MEIGLKAAGLMPLWAVEYDPAIAGVYRANHGDHIIVGDVRQVDYATLARPDLLWLSPPCPSFSVAKTGRGETANDLSIAAACAAAIETLRPGAVILENVRGYADSESFRIIRAAIDRLDYWSHAQVVNAADCGTPQTRERLILRAIPGGWMQAHRPWPAPVRWRGWYEAIADLVPTLPDSAFAPWQLARLPAELRESLMPSAVNADGTTIPRTGREPSFTVQATAVKQMPRAFILDGQESSAASGLTVLHGEEPCYTVTAGSGTKRGARAYLVSSKDTGNEWGKGHRTDEEPALTVVTDHKPSHMPRALIPPGRVVAMTPRALSVFQSVPRWYRIPMKSRERRLNVREQKWIARNTNIWTPAQQDLVHEWLMGDNSLACKVFGNGVAIDVAKCAAETLRGTS